MTYRAPGRGRQAQGARSDCLMMFRQRVIEASLLEGAELDAIDRGGQAR